MATEEYIEKSWLNEIIDLIYGSLYLEIEL